MKLPTCGSTPNENVCSPAQPCQIVIHVINATFLTLVLLSVRSGSSTKKRHSKNVANTREAVLGLGE